jgi:transposase
MKTTKTYPHKKQFKTIIGVDLGDKKHHVCVTGKDGTILCEKTVTNNKEQLTRLAHEHKGALFAIEVGTHSPWISRLIEANGCSCLVANARKLRAIYQNDRKCDQFDARMLAKLARADSELLSPIQHGSETRQMHRLSITLRDSLVRQRVDIISTLRFSLKSLGVRITGCSTPSFARRCREDLEDTPLLDTVEATLQALDGLNSQIKALDKQIARIAAEHYPETKLLEQIGGVGPITSLSFVLAIGEPDRFEDPRDVGAYFGLVPRRDQSGQSDKQLPISKAGNREMRRLLVQCAQYILGHHGPDCDLRRHGLILAAKGGRSAKRKAVIAIARKLAVLMLMLWKTGDSYEPLRNTPDEKTRSKKAA